MLVISRGPIVEIDLHAAAVENRYPPDRIVDERLQACMMKSALERRVCAARPRSFRLVTALPTTHVQARKRRAVGTMDAPAICRAVDRKAGLPCPPVGEDARYPRRNVHPFSRRKCGDIDIAFALWCLRGGTPMLDARATSPTTRSAGRFGRDSDADAAPSPS
jgi:hypothetical protein